MHFCVPNHIFTVILILKNGFLAESCLMSKLSIKFTRKVAGVSSHAGVSPPDLVIQLRDDQTHCPYGRKWDKGSPEVAQGSPVKSSKSESSSPDAVSAAGRNHTAAFLSFFPHCPMEFEPSQSSSSFHCFRHCFVEDNLFKGHTPNFKF